MSYDGSDDRREATKWYALGWVWVIIALVFFALIGVAVWAFGVATSEVKGQGDAARDKNSSDNWVQKQEEFNKRYQSIKSQDKNITIAWKELQADPEDQVKQINYSGLVRNCNSSVGEYNSLAREYNAKDFRDSDLPSEIDETDPTTDCKEDK